MLWTFLFSPSPFPRYMWPLYPLACSEPDSWPLYRTRVSLHVFVHPDPRLHWTVRGRRRRYFECMDDRAGFEYHLRCPWRSDTVDCELFVSARRQAFQRWVVRLSATNRSWVSPFRGKSVQGLFAAVHDRFHRLQFAFSSALCLPGWTCSTGCLSFLLSSIGVLLPSLSID